MHIDNVGLFLISIFVSWLLLFAAMAAAIRVNRDRYPERLVRECPHCREPIRRDATVCRYCRRDVKPLTFHEGRWWSVDDEGRDIWLDEQRGEWKRHVPPR